MESNSEGEGAAYDDDDFEEEIEDEEISHEDGGAVAAPAAPGARIEGSAARIQGAPSDPFPRPRGDSLRSTLGAAEEPGALPQSRGGRRTVEPNLLRAFGDKDGPAMARFGLEAEENPDLGRTVSSSSSSTRRLVRGKVSLTSDELLSADRPGTGQSGQAAVKDPRPLWLQHDDRAMAASRERDSRLPSRMRPDAAEPPRSGLGGSRARPNDLRNISDRGSEMDDPILAGPDDARKVKRLQQEIQRLSQRMAESEIYSAKDDELPKFTLEEVEIGCQIAQGGFSSVHNAQWQCTPCALKKIFDPVLTEELKSEFENEVRMLRRLRHPNVVTLMAVCRKPPALSVLTEYVSGGSLFMVLHDPLHSRPRGAPDCEPGVLLPVLNQAAAALAYIHAMLVVHRDIKSQNVLLTEGRRPTAKLCDFGLARMRSELCTGSMQYAGTAPYMAPELFAKKKYDETVDVFAFGTMTWEVVSTEIPHANLDPSDIAHRVQTKDAAGLTIVHSWPKSFKALLRSSLAVQPEKRPSMVEFTRQLAEIILEFPAADP